MSEYLEELLKNDIRELKDKNTDLRACAMSLLAIVEVSNCCDSPLYRYDIEAIKARLDGSK